MPPNVFAIDSMALRRARVERAESRLEVSEVDTFELEPGAFYEGPLGGPLRDPAGFSARLVAMIANAGQPIEQASLVLPDRWLRMMFAEITELPESPEARLEALRFKLRRLLPFRVEDLRISGVEVPPLDGQDEPRRVLLSFAVQALLAQLEELFLGAGVRIGLIASESVCLSAALPRTGAVGLLRATDDGYSLLVVVDGEPVLYRYKTLSPGLTDAIGAVVTQDFRLTRSFLEERLPHSPPLQVWIGSHEQAPWRRWVAEGLGSTPRDLVREALQADHQLAPEFDALVIGPMLGAALQEVS